MVLTPQPHRSRSVLTNEAWRTKSWSHSSLTATIPAALIPRTRSFSGSARIISETAVRKVLIRMGWKEPYEQTEMLPLDAESPRFLLLEEHGVNTPYRPGAISV